MHSSLIVAVLATVIISTVSASPFLEQRASGPPFPGVATFNNYTDQVLNRNQPTVCHDYLDEGTVFGAAAGDLSPNISAGRCDYTAADSSQLSSVCTEPDSQGNPDQQPNSATYHGPSCPAFCGNCYKVVNNDNGNSVTIKIVDSCPALSAYNYCKTLIEPAGKCSGPSNALDISVNAYPLLVTGGSADATNNLENLSITPLASCSD